jgi:hypothetical protein
MATRGRRPKGEYAGKTSVMSFRITPGTKDKLKRAAALSGRSLSQEAEYRLRRALDDDMIIENLIESMSAVQSLKANWSTDPAAFDQAAGAIVEALKAFYPLSASAALHGSSTMVADSVVLPRSASRRKKR